jgi:hypothetical protein
VVEEMVVKEVLSEQMIEAGKELLEALDKRRQIDISSALWLYEPANITWQLVLASPSVSIVGPRQVYRIILGTLADLREKQLGLTLDDIQVVPSDDPLILKFKLGLGRDEIRDVRFNRNAVGGQYIEDAYIYKLS